jgi:hypothetical protein
LIARSAIGTDDTQELFYFDVDGQLVAMRNENWKFVFCEQRAPDNRPVTASIRISLKNATSEGRAEHPTEAGLVIFIDS